MGTSNVLSKPLHNRPDISEIEFINFGTIKDG